MTTIKVTSEIVIELGREGTTSPRVASAEIFSTAVQESGKEDGSDTVTVVTPRRLHVYRCPSKFPVPVQEVNADASAKLVC